MEDIRLFYDKFLLLCKGKQYKYISKRVLYYLFHLKESAIIELFDNFDYNKESNSNYSLDRINVYELLSVMIWTSYSNKESKLKCTLIYFNYSWI